MGFPGVSEGKESARSVGDLGSILVLGGSPGGGRGNLLWCSCLGNPMDRRALWATAHRIAEADMTQHTCMSQVSLNDIDET